MSNLGDRYVKQLQDLDSTIKRLNKTISDARKKKKDTQKHLYAWMVKNNVDKLGGYTVKKIAPKLHKAKRKPPKQKKEDALKLFNEIGITDPEAFWEEFEKTQKVILPEGEEGQNDEEG